MGNSRFKFRVWDKENKCLHYPTRYHNYCIVNGTIVKIESYPTANSAYLGKRVVWEFDDAVIMQCTGLKDKNGKLIYEGDIVKTSKGIANVEYDNTYAYFGLTNFLTVFSFDNFINEKIEVIGNIYENKELLNENS